jgi:hypothetical protein
VFAVQKHQAAVVERDGPPSRRIHDLGFTGIYADSNRVTEVLNHRAGGFGALSPMYPHPSTDR